MNLKFNKNLKYKKNILFIIKIVIILIFCFVLIFFGKRFLSKKNDVIENKDTLLIGTSSEIKNGFGMFGMGANTTNNAQVRNLIHEYLISSSEIKKNNHYYTEYKEKLIEKIPTSAIKHGKFKDYYEFNLKSGIKFHNGDELTNDDVLETLNLNNSTKGEHSYFIDDFAKPTDNSQKYKFYIKFKDDKNSLNYHHLSKIPIINKKLMQTDFENFRNIGLGAFKLKKFDPNTKTIELSFFSDYFRLSNRVSSNIKNIIIHFIPSVQTLYMNLEKGKLDLILENTDQVYLENMTQNKKLKLVENDNLNLTYIILNSNTLSIENRKSIVQVLTPKLKTKILEELGEDLSYCKVVNYFSDNRLKGGDISDNDFDHLITNDKSVIAAKPNKKIKALFTNIDETKNRFMNKFLEILSNEEGFKIEKLQFEKNETIAKAKSGDFDIFCLTEYLENTFPHYLLNVYFGKIYDPNNPNVIPQNSTEINEAYFNVSCLNEPDIYEKIEYLKKIDFNTLEYENKIKELHEVLTKKYITIPLFQINKIRNLLRHNIEGFNVNIFGEIDWLNINKV
ncbi:ABC transporter substrate-binding protein [Candidatus Phytoplasma sacchari]|uniref:ABC transporter substrate-binding protein n=1 Tax=Candidatus Phytoplasma sacchari TaxID=2609813 RepID=A0ABY7M449_9MOLU|nr:ABC transporter substrate-binding protein [Candidatus Phytoplasma sacchari]